MIIFYNSIFYRHKPPQGIYHPENPKRLDIALNGIRANDLWEHIKNVNVVEDRYRNYKLRIHSEDYIALIDNFCSSGNEGFIDSDTYVCRDTCAVANYASYLSAHAMEIALDTKGTLIFVLARPPGHHVGLNGRAMGAPTQGFCVFNNIAIATTYALDKGYKPVAIIDIDVHHGNGTQEIFWEDPNVVHIDVHEHGIYPGTGYSNDLGGGEGYGTKINIPMSSFSGDNDYIYVFKEIVSQLIYNIKPKVLAISAGFDAYKDDGLASMELTENFYKFFGSVISQFVKELGISAIAVLEGGYSIGLERGLPALLKGFVEPIDINIETAEASRTTIYTVKSMRNIIKDFYKL
uniref:Histone deacetylase family protein n=1 Tax=Ignisphaera aggregans TaxID=334771 RepID=A0A7J3MWE9_9CREN